MSGLVERYANWIETQALTEASNNHARKPGSFEHFKYHIDRARHHDAMAYDIEDKHDGEEPEGGRDRSKWGDHRNLSDKHMGVIHDHYGEDAAYEADEGEGDAHLKKVWNKHKPK